MKNTIASLILSTILTVSLCAQKLTDSLIFNAPFNNSLNENGPFNLPIWNNNALTFENDRKNNLTQSINFNGTSSYVMYSTGGTSFHRNLPITFTCWVNIAQNTGIMPLFYSNSHATSYYGFFIQIANGKVNASFGNGGGTGSTNRRTIASTNSLTVGTWTHIAVTINDANNFKLYIDGVLDQSATLSGSATSMNVVNSLQSIVGNIGTSYFKGNIDNIMIWNRILDIEEVNSVKELILYNEFGNEIKEFGPSAIGVQSTSISTINDRFGKPSNAIKFDGVSSKISLSNVKDYKISFPFSINVWVCPEIENSNVPIFVSSDHTSSAYFGFNLAISNGYPTANFGDGASNGSGNRKTFSATTKLSIKNWHYITMVANSISSVEFYINGLQSNVTNSGNAQSMSHNNNNSALFGYLTTGNSNKYFKGRLDEFSLINRAQDLNDHKKYFSIGIHMEKQTTDTTVNLNDTLTRTVEAIGTQNTNYLWQRYLNNSWTNLSSQNTQNLTISNIQYVDTGLYRCYIVSVNDNYFTYSNPVRIKIKPQQNSSILHEENQIVKIFPNPSNSQIQITGNFKDLKSYKIYNLTGECVINGEVNDSILILNIDSLKSGIYFIDLIKKDGQVVKNKIIKE